MSVPALETPFMCSLPPAPKFELEPKHVIVERDNDSDSEGLEGCDHESIHGVRGLADYFTSRATGILELIKHHEVTERKLKESEKSRNALKDRLQRTEKELKDTKGRLTDTEKKLDAKDKELQSTKTRLGETEAQLKKANADLAETKTKLTKTEEQLRASKQKLAEAEKKCGELEKKVKDTECKLATAEKELKDTKTKLTTAEKNLKTTEAELKETKTKLSAAEKKLNDVDCQLTAAKAERDQAKKDLKKSQDDYENLERLSADTIRDARGDRDRARNERDQAVRKYEKADKELKEEETRSQQWQDQALRHGGSSSNSRDPKRQKGDFYIDAVVYGGVNIVGDCSKAHVIAELLKHAVNSTQFRITNDFMGGDPWHHHTKSATIVYSVKGGANKYINKQEWDYAKFEK